MGKYIAKRVSLLEATLENEVWKDVVGYEGKYKISNFARVYSEVRKNLLNPSKNKLTGYYQIPFGDRKNRKSFRLHRVVAQAFIPNPFNKKEVNHKNKDKEDNKVDNLEWMNAWENQAHRHGIKTWNNWQGRIASQDYSVARRKMKGFSEKIIPMLEKIVPLK
jgi:hypothetical protein